MSQSVQLIIRQATHDDAEQLVEIYEQFSIQTPYLTDEPTTRTQPQRYFQKVDQISQYYKHPTSLMLVVELRGEMIAVATLATLADVRQSHVAELGVGVLKDYWNQGIATMLVEELLSFAQEVGLKVITLEVVQENERAMHLYQKFNFKTVGALSNRVCVNDQYYDTYILEYLL